MDTVPPSRFHYDLGGFPVGTVKKKRKTKIATAAWTTKIITAAAADEVETSEEQFRIGTRIRKG